MNNFYILCLVCTFLSLNAEASLYQGAGLVLKGKIVNFRTVDSDVQVKLCPKYILLSDIDVNEQCNDIIFQTSITEFKKILQSIPLVDIKENKLRLIDKFIRNDMMSVEIVEYVYRGTSSSPVSRLLYALLQNEGSNLLKKFHIRQQIRTEVKTFLDVRQSTDQNYINIDEKLVLMDNASGYLKIGNQNGPMGTWYSPIRCSSDIYFFTGKKKNERTGDLIDFIGFKINANEHSIKFNFCHARQFLSEDTIRKAFLEMRGEKISRFSKMRNITNSGVFNFRGTIKISDAYYPSELIHLGHPVLGIYMLEK